MAKKNGNNSSDASNTAVIDAEFVDESSENTGDTSNDVSAPTNDDIPVISAQRQFFMDNPGAVHEFNTDELAPGAAILTRVQRRTAKDDDIKAMAESIKEHGQMVAGEVRLGLDDKLTITDGMGRFLAISDIINPTRNAADKLPFLAKVVIETEDTQQAFIRSAVYNLHRKETSVLDKAKIVKDLMESGMKQSEIMTRIGLKKATVSTLAKVAALPDQVKTWIAEDKISAKAAYDLAVVDPTKVEAAAKELIDAACGERVSASAANKKRGKGGEDGEEDESDDAGKPAKKQRTTKQILDFVEAEATTATDKKYGSKNVSVMLKLFGKFAAGMAEGTFLKNLAAVK